VTTSAVTAITETSAASGGNVTSDGGTTVTVRGVCWSTAANPTTANSHTSNGTGTGAFVSSLTGLTAGTAYHVRAYATNSAGTAYGADVSFTTSAQPGTPPRFTSDRRAVFQVLSFDSFTVTATGNPAPTLGVVGRLPDGVTFDPATGVLGGTPTSTGNYKFTFTAVNGVAPNATQSFMLHVQRTKQKAVPRTPASDTVDVRRARRR
jgi:hypothetical protein